MPFRRHLSQRPHPQICPGQPLHKFLANNLGLGTHATLATVSLRCVLAIEYHDHFLNLGISDHLFHELYCVMAFFEVPLVDSYIYTVLSELTRKVENPFLMIVRAPPVGNERPLD